MEGADTTAENLMLDMRKHGKQFPVKALKRIGISLLHLHEHGIVHGDFGTHNIGKFGSRWKILGVGGCIPLGRPTQPSRGFYHPPEAITVENRRGNPMGKRSYAASVVSIPANPSYDIWAYGVAVYEGIAGLPLGPYACRGKRAMTSSEVSRIGMWDENSLRKALKYIPDNDNGAARDMIRFLLHPDPEKRATSMRQVLEHPFFSQAAAAAQREQIFQKTSFGADDHTAGGSMRSKRTTEPSSPFDEPHFEANFDQVNGVMNNISHNRQPQQQPPSVKQTGSGSTDYSAENRENGVSRHTSDAESVKSGRSFGGFRKFAKKTLRSSSIHY